LYLGCLSLAGFSLLCSLFFTRLCWCFWFMHTILWSCWNKMFLTLTLTLELTLAPHISLALSHLLLPAPSASHSCPVSYSTATATLKFHGRRLRGARGDGPQIWGGGTAHASAPPNILRSIVLLDTLQSTNWLKKDVVKECFVGVSARKGS